MFSPRKDFSYYLHALLVFRFTLGSNLPIIPKIRTNGPETLSLNFGLVTCKYTSNKDEACAR